MKQYCYVMLMKNANPLSLDIIQRHVNHLRELDLRDLLVVCGPFVDTQGGMVVFKADSLEEAHRLANQDPFILFGYKTYELRALEVANAQNNYGLY